MHVCALQVVTTAMNILNVLCAYFPLVKTNHTYIYIYIIYIYLRMYLQFWSLLW